MISFLVIASVLTNLVLTSKWIQTGFLFFFWSPLWHFHLAMSKAFQSWHVQNQPQERSISSYSHPHWIISPSIRWRDPETQVSSLTSLASHPSSEYCQVLLMTSPTCLFLLTQHLDLGYILTHRWSPATATKLVSLLAALTSTSCLSLFTQRPEESVWNQTISFAVHCP